ncbi:MAG: zinc ribbon domain-containing protein [Terracidiphilus sp.]
MFCSGCGHVLEPGQAVCPQCGRPVAPIAPVLPPVPNLQFELASYASKIRVLGILWLVFAGVSLLFGIAGLGFLHAFFSGGFGPWMHGNTPPMWFFPALLRFAWVIMVGRAILSAVAGWGLLERTEWGRIVAIVAAILSLFHVFPFGLILGVATLIILIGARNWTLYER